MSVDDPVRVDAGRPCAAPATIIRLEGVGKRFGSHRAVAGVSLDLAAGEFFCLLGPSGCGKSTLLRMLAGFESPDEGTIALDGLDLAAVPPHRRPVNMMFQSYALFPHLTVAGNVAYGLKLAGLSRRDVAARLAEMLRLVRLEGLGARYPAQLSGGQKQRVALARALARRPRVLLLDEPLAALDKSLRADTQAELKELQVRLGTTFVMVTHDQDEAMSLSDRIGVMHEGRLVQVGTPREVYQRPVSRFVAGFVGEANMLDGRLGGRSGPFGRVALPDGSELEACCPDDLEIGQPVALVIRPERMSLGGEVGGGNVLAGRVEEVAFLGRRSMLRVLTASAASLSVEIGEHAPVPAGAYARGDEVRITFPASAALLLR